ncbi:hypothetical protein PM10SUCC1_37560 [Propionigenium maris DSM 9537]|uniref:Uncharacterized protein n=1 Tax=Propionigenium maris DSM 9537 TaxID=1123000 RepID=A0A9W6GQD6_9FUSO|nr:hypothetical protein [Propionigenium maris]GLI58242.1 hypothetical protein PM10SUCC1_37560 [Propionigenium maris DSM 9537]
MKNLILTGLLLVSVASLGRDYEYRGRRELEEVGRENREYQERMSKLTPEEYSIAREKLESEREENIKKYSDFHRELDDMDRGSENK